MPYLHGVYSKENDTPVKTPVIGGAIQVVVGTAPVNLASKVYVNEPVLIRSLTEAKEKLGYSKSFDKFTLCQSMYATFEVVGVAPIVMINVLDPETHKTVVEDEVVTPESDAFVIQKEGIMMATLEITSSDGLVVYQKDTDYTAVFDTNGYVSVKLIGEDAPGAVALKASYTHLDPSKVTENDVIGSYNEATNIYKGIDVIRQIYPIFNEVPGLLLAPGFSHKPNIARKLEAFTKAINGSFNTDVILDLLSDTVNRANVIKWKADNAYTAKSSVVLYLKSKINDVVLYTSALLAAALQKSDVEHDGVPVISSSNISLPITAAVLEDGTEVYLDQLQANELNAAGIVTILNIGGWKTWGNNTAAYPEVVDPKERFVMTRRIFDYINNDFAQSFFKKVDNPTNYRLIEEVVDEYNLKLNSLQAQGYILSGKIIFRMEDNPIENILDGVIQFLTSVSGNIPAKAIVNVMQYDVSGLVANLGGN